MPEHYFTAAPESAHARREIICTACGVGLRFITDAGVFSRDGLDPGSRLLIESAPPLAGNVLDLGCGWGPVGLFLKKTNPAIRLTMADVNERALGLAQENAALNGLEASAVLSDGFSAIHDQFDFVLTNPPIRTGKALIYSLFDEAYAHLTDHGRLLVVIRKQQGAPSALKHFQERFDNGEVIARGGGYWIIQAIKQAQE